MTDSHKSSRKHRPEHSHRTLSETLINVWIAIVALLWTVGSFGAPYKTTMVHGEYTAKKVYLEGVCCVYWMILVLSRICGICNSCSVCVHLSGWLKSYLHWHNTNLLFPSASGSIITLHNQLNKARTQHSVVLSVTGHTLFKCVFCVQL